MNSVLSIKGLQKRYRRVTAVKSLDLEIPRGSVYGILGPNGSGKTTTLGMILEVIRPSAGSFQWQLRNGKRAEARRKMGVLLETPNFYPYLSGLDNLKITAAIKGAQNVNYHSILERVNLAERAKDRFGSYSLGMKQRLAIAGAMVNDPEVMVLDEPTNGLDPEGIAEVRALIKDIAQSGITVILASHILAEVEKLCDHVAVLKKGELIYQGLARELVRRHFQLHLAGAQEPELRNALKTLPGYIALERAEAEAVTADGSPLFYAEFSEKIDPAEVNRQLAQQGIILSHLSIHQKSLEDDFLELIKNEEHAA